MKMININDTEEDNNQWKEDQETPAFKRKRLNPEIKNVNQ